MISRTPRPTQGVSRREDAPGISIVVQGCGEEAQGAIELEARPSRAESQAGAAIPGQAHLGITIGATSEIGQWFVLPGTAVIAPQGPRGRVGDFNGSVRRKGQRLVAHHGGRRARASQAQIGPQRAVQRPPGAVPAQIEVGAVPGGIKVLGLQAALIIVQLFAIGQPFTMIHIEEAVDDDRLLALAKSGVGDVLNMPGTIVEKCLVAHHVPGAQVNVPIANAVQKGIIVRSRHCLPRLGIGGLVHGQENGHLTAGIHGGGPGDAQGGPDLQVALLRGTKGCRRDARWGHVIHRDGSLDDRMVAGAVCGAHPDRVADGILVLGQVLLCTKAAAVQVGREPGITAIHTDLHLGQTAVVVAGGALEGYGERYIGPTDRRDHVQVGRDTIQFHDDDAIHAARATGGLDREGMIAVRIRQGDDHRPGAERRHRIGQIGLYRRLAVHLHDHDSLARAGGVANIAL